MNQIIRIPESPVAETFLQSLMCRKHKGEDLRALRLHPWNHRETRDQVLANVGHLPEGYAQLVEDRIKEHALNRVRAA